MPFSKTFLKKTIYTILICIVLFLIYMYYNLFRHLFISPTVLSSVIPAKESFIPYTPNSLSSSALVNFDLGPTSFKTSTGDELILPIQGTLGIPRKSTTPAPICFILPGYKEGLNSSRIDIGYTYLIQALADQGYLAIALNIPPNLLTGQDTTQLSHHLTTLFDMHFQNLEQALTGQNFIYDNIDLANIGDLSNVFFLSHSLNAELVYSLISNSTFANKFNTSGLLFVAPLYNSNTSFSLLDIPTAIILPQLDGCVVSLDGQSLYNDLILDQNRNSLTNLIYLYGANHTAFNSTAELDDSDALFTQPTFVSQISAHDQRDFLTNYTLDFLDFLLQPNHTSPTLSASLPSPSKLYGYNVLTSLDIPPHLPLLSPSGIYSECLNALGGKIAPQNASIAYVIDSYLPTKDTAGAFSLPGNPLEFPLLRLSWSVPSSSIATFIPPRYRDFSYYTALSLTLGVDPTNPLNQINKSQSFIIELKDLWGKSQRILLDPSTSALRYHPGSLITNNFTSYWSTFTPISSLRIPLSLFNHIDLTNIYSITFIFNQTKSGSLMLSDMSLITEYKKSGMSN